VSTPHRRRGADTESYPILYTRTRSVYDASSAGLRRFRGRSRSRGITAPRAAWRRGTTQGTSVGRSGDSPRVSARVRSSRPAPGRGEAGSCSSCRPAAQALAHVGRGAEGRVRTDEEILGGATTERVTSTCRSEQKGCISRIIGKPSPFSPSPCGPNSSDTTNGTACESKSMTSEGCHGQTNSWHA